MQSIVCVSVIAYFLIVNVNSASLAKRKLLLTEYMLSDNNDKQFGAEVFRIPRALRKGDAIFVTGRMKTDKQSVTVNLVKENAEGSPDYSNVVCQVKLDFPNAENTKDTIFVNSIIDGKLTENYEDLLASEVFINEHLAVVFKMKNSKIEIDLHSAPTINECFIDRIEDIKFLTMGGDVEKVEILNFFFG